MGNFLLFCFLDSRARSDVLDHCSTPDAHRSNDDEAGHASQNDGYDVRVPPYVARLYVRMQRPFRDVRRIVAMKNRRQVDGRR